MKLIALIFLSLFTFSTLHSQSFNTEITTEKQSVLLGKINKEKLNTSPYSEWFTKNFNEYQPDKSTINQFKDELSEYTITAFLGTWCGDSKREVPKLYKVLAKANFPLDRLTTVAVSRERDSYKQSPGGEHEGMNIHRVPTIIFYKDGVEVNRMVESPVQSVEEDITSILRQNYTPNYQSVQVVNEALTTMGTERFQKKSKKIAKQLKPITKNMYDLNTFSNVLFYSNKKEEAIAIAKLNLLLFPDEANAKKSLENKLSK